MRRYLDNNAFTPHFYGARQSFLQSLDTVGNPSSVHGCGRAVKSQIQSVRSKIANFLHKQEKTIIFTSGATESHNMILKGHVGPVAVMATAHPSVTKVRQDCHIVDVDKNGLLKLEKFETFLKNNSNALVSIIAAHNETGVVQNPEDIYVLCQKYGAVLHIDAVQAFGKINYPFDMCDFVTINGHKWGGPLGVGVISAKSIDKMPKILIYGGGQEYGYRSGSENAPAIIAFGKAIDEIDTNSLHHHKKWHEDMVKEIKKICPDAECISEGVRRLPNTTCLTMPGVSSQTQLMHFDLNGFSVSAGSACSSGSIKKSPSLIAMGHPHAEFAVRVSTGWKNTKDDLKNFTNCWKSLFNKSQRKEVA